MRFQSINEINLTPVWAQLHLHQRSTKHVEMRDLFEAEPDRFLNFSIDLNGFLLDFSKNRITGRSLDLLVELSKVAGLSDWIEAARLGEQINTSEHRSVMHFALRADVDDVYSVDEQNVVPVVHQELRRCFDFSEKIRQKTWCGFDGSPIRDVVNIGIGGSDLGPRLVVQALHPYALTDIRVHFVSNLDGADLAQTLEGLDQATTLFIVSSKSFSTPETLDNAYAAKAWFLQKAQGSDVSKHFVAISSNVEAVKDFGIAPELMFRFWDWVGGRYSVWSAIGLSVMIAIGERHFRAFLDGAREMDQHFFTAPHEKNIPVVMALLGVWYNTFYGAHTHAIMPYAHGLARLPAYLQQLDMESNGKRVGRFGEMLDFDTGPVVWGEVGVNSQHAFFQLLHQGTRLVPCDFILPLRSHYAIGQHHQQLVANCLAQTEALMRGKTDTEVLEELQAAGVTGELLDALLPQKVFPGNQPSNTIVIDELSPRFLGMLLAAYEHKVFVQGVIWGINSFDQWGVEYGKQLAKRIAPELASTEPPEHDSSTNALIERYRTRGCRS
ncbi:glucose-6-phosphate isomerase [Laribacter hongkongensis]|uniref:glucose-6-phosphate isomerase n=1 Tax=Laribacter hongkongensis TaxID=168471 RepID=UPI001EFCDB18|nr:glucose-6-phosphate isomerase [Laribacter hongkongensis]MCG9116975.1 glucose-6-phosphate isomerase [Laribacter hongkongensis]MCG9125936.1 glucose-6-phosphate isomerase [Laribacter hongkongensis]